MINQTSWVRINRGCASCLLTLALAGCATQPQTVPLYEGHRKPVDQIAVVTSEFPKLSPDVASNLRGGSAQSLGRYSVELLPGNHQLQVRLHETYSNGRTMTVLSSKWTPLSIDVSAGHIYFISGVITGETWRPQVEDVTDYATLNEHRRIILTPKLKGWARDWYERTYPNSKEWKSAGFARPNRLVHYNPFEH